MATPSTVCYRQPFPALTESAAMPPSPATAEHRKTQRSEAQAALVAQLQVALAGGQEADVAALLAELHPGEIANLLASLPIPQREAVWRQMPQKRIGAVLTKVTEGVRERLLADTDPGLLVEAIRDLDVDDIADLIPGLPEDLYAEVLYGVDKDAHAGLSAVLSFDENTAGGLMNVDAVVVRDNLSLAAVMRYLRKKNELPEYTDKLFIVDRANKLTGILPLSALLTAGPELQVAQVMDGDPVEFNVNTSKDEVAASFQRYNLISAPVTDDQGRLLGRITIDDVVEVIRTEADHVIMASAGLKEEEDIFAPPLRTFKGRGLWLGVNLLTAIVASWVIGQFEATIEKLVALAVLMPIIASMGGNAGTQTMTMVVRGIGLGTVNRRNVFRLLRKEATVGGFNGLLWAVVAAAVALAWYGDWLLCLVMAAAMCVNMVSSAFAGVLIPALFDRMGVDPALASGVALTTVTDVVGFFAVLGLAAVFI